MVFFPATFSCHLCPYLSYLQPSSLILCILSLYTICQLVAAPSQVMLCGPGHEESGYKQTPLWLATAPPLGDQSLLIDVTLMRLSGCTQSQAHG